ncbi:MAG: hypothetical protein ABFD18_04630 [Syntrophomonas sp.]
MIINSDLQVLNGSMNVHNRQSRENSVLPEGKNAENNLAVNPDIVAIDAKKLTAAENIKAAESPLRDASQVREALDYTRHNILTQPSSALEAQTGQLSGAVAPLLE